jgi:nucleoside 2-deoxyribosyltransferase
MAKGKPTKKVMQEDQRKRQEQNQMLKNVSQTPKGLIYTKG